MAAVAVCAFEEPQSHTLRLWTLSQQLFGSRPSSITVSSRNPQLVLLLSSQTLFPICACLEGCHMPKSCLPIWKCTRAFQLGKKFQGRSRKRCECIKMCSCSYYTWELWLGLVLLSACSIRGIFKAHLVPWQLRVSANPCWSLDFWHNT